MSQKSVELANFVITAGEQGLLELFPERIWPRLKTARVAGRGETIAYKFLDLKLADLGPAGLPCLMGRIARIMNLQAEQVISANEDSLVPSQDRIPSAPSSFFIVTLADHRLAFLPESRRRSPTLRDLEYCFEKILRDDWYERLMAARKKTLEDIGKKRLPKGEGEMWREEVGRAFPHPEVRITPLAASKELKKRFELYELLSAVEIRPLKTNNELADESEEFLRQYEGVQRRVGSRQNKIELKNAKEGLNKPEAQKLVEKASNGNYRVRLKGKDKNGHPLQLDLEELRLKIVYELRRESIPQRAFRLLQILTSALQTHAVSAQAATADSIARAKALVQRLSESEGA